MRIEREGGEMRAEQLRRKRREEKNGSKNYGEREKEET